VPNGEKAGLMRSVNDGIAFFATDLEPHDAGAGDRWTFVCECGAPGCAEWVELELAEYELIRAGADAVVLAPGHVPASPAERARSEAEATRESSRALRGQAKQQRDRAQRLADD
jgi:hypothetical protein